MEVLKPAAGLPAASVQTSLSPSLALAAHGRLSRCHYQGPKRSKASVTRAAAAADLGSLMSQTQMPSSGEMWDLGFADCEAETCGLVPDGSLVLVIQLAFSSARFAYTSWCFPLLLV